MATRSYDERTGEAKGAPKGRLRTLVESTAFLVICIVVAAAALIVLLLFPDLLAGLAMIIVIAIAVVAVIAVIASVVMTIVAVPLYLAKGEYRDDMDYDISDVKEKNESEKD
ncbi:MAG: hypothetical protein PHW93_04240 [Candidatus Methanomethylophilaceae archaeon]|jgi:uncharacterized membrane protein YdbT with pleckstrin-like domain|nr:hypothetical protein [Candidatus Methanomethylophilaceae archaeon]NCB64510.1 hypothetical protein [Clostridia bacterium]